LLSSVVTLAPVKTHLSRIASALVVLTAGLIVLRRSRHEAPEMPGTWEPAEQVD